MKQRTTKWQSLSNIEIYFIYRAVMSNQFNSQTLGFSDTAQLPDSTQVMTCKLVLRVPHCQQNANRVLQMQAALKSSCLNADTISLIPRLPPKNMAIFICVQFLVSSYTIDENCLK